VSRAPVNRASQHKRHVDLSTETVQLNYPCYLWFL